MAIIKFDPHKTTLQEMGEAIDTLANSSAATKEQDFLDVLKQYAKNPDGSLFSSNHPGQVYKFVYDDDNTTHIVVPPPNDISVIHTPTVIEDAVKDDKLKYNILDTNSQNPHIYMGIYLLKKCR